ncbi:hypothetical protein IPC744_22130 [Pseudomonas aeruginosa]|uniref:DNA methyltransferase n=1 Tax=Pseudomonas aeruginosa TaxID=287 RepID=UPI000F52F100|nr:DNA methyltransferase [Pseudomonas aeruginosa]RPW60539.1 hypothetical protein IPC744_22130 [Pseudomonas aeruginosa]HCT8840439.1 site-specific DNA-methyltransferase [Pseudomonas aeruginosa]
MSYSLEAINQLDGIDWSFPSLANSGIHSFHWYPATYIAAIPGTLIPFFAKEGEVVLDPFCGSGTTGVEAIRLGRRFIGVDTNPVALLMTNAKLSFPDPGQLRKVIDDVIRRAESLFGMAEVPEHPRAAELLDWYHPETMNTLNRLLASIMEVKSDLFREALLSVYSGVLKNCSSQGKHWGWVCDNVKPKASEIVFKDAISAFAGAANDYLKFSKSSFDSVKVHDSGVKRADVRGRYSLFHGSCVDELRRLSPGAVDFIMTSPPYYGVADYVKSQRLTYLWFDVDELAEKNLGFRSFEALRKNEAGARSNRFRKNSHSLYMDFMRAFFAQCYRVLKNNGYMALVVGESQAREATTEILIDSAIEEGFSLSCRAERDIKQSRRRLMAKVKGEDILILQRIEK